MGTVNVNLGEASKLNLILGQQLENAVTSVVFDFSAWQTAYGSGTLGLSVQRPGDEMPYAVTMTVSGTNATWNITSLDTAYKGVGEIQVTYTVGSVVKKSVVYKFTVYKSLGENGEYPSPGQTWQEGIEDEIDGLHHDLTIYNESLNSSNGYVEMDISTYEQQPYHLENGTWSVSSYKCVLIPVDDLGDKVKFVATSYKCSYAFLKSNTISVGNAPDLCTGESIKTVAIGNSAVDNVPSDCKYMYLYVAQNQYVNYKVYSHLFVVSLKELKDGVDSVVVEAEGGYITKTYPYYEKLTGYYTSDAGNLTANSSYDTYVYKADRNIQIYFKNESQTSNYISLVGYTTNSYDSSHRLFTRKRYQSGVENTLPQENSKQTFTEGQFLAISIPVDQNYNLYGYRFVNKLNNDLEFNTSHITKIQEIAQAEAGSSFVQYQTESTSESSAEQLGIYVPTGKNYIKYRFVHTVMASRNADVWRMGIADAVDSNFTTIIPVTTGSEWECALKISGRNDFSGGYSHGDEIGSNLLIFVDGAEVQLSDLTDMVPFKEIRLVTYSSLYDPNDGTTLIAYHGCERIIADGKLTINQTIKWMQNEMLDACYLAMFGPRKQSDGIIVTSDYYTDASYEPISIPNPVARTINGVTEAVLFAGDSGFSASVKINKYPTGNDLVNNGNAIISDNSGENYNKLYFIVCTAGTVSVGDIWKSQTVYKLDFPN